MFQNLRTNSQIYILHKDAKPYVEAGTISGVTAPKPRYPSAMPPIGQLPQMDMVVDVTASVNGQPTTFQNLPAGAEIADFGQNGNIVISCTRDAMNAEISSMRQRSLDIVNSEDYHRGVIAGCDEMLKALNPEFAEKQRQEQEISELKRQMSELLEMNRSLMQKLSSAEAPAHVSRPSSNVKKEQRNGMEND